MLSPKKPALISLSSLSISRFDFAHRPELVERWRREKGGEERKLRITLATIYLSLGSNLADRIGYLKEAIKEIKKSDEISIETISSVYETAPVGHENQPQFLNLVLKGETSLEPFFLLEHVLAIEDRMGRKREEKWGPRNIDIDILLYDDLVIESDRLILPHPRMHERKFVLVPLALIVPNLLHPLLGKNVRELLDSCEDNSKINLFAEKL